MTVPSPDPVGTGSAEPDVPRTERAPDGTPMESTASGSTSDDGVPVGEDDAAADVAAAGGVPERNADDV